MQNPSAFVIFSDDIREEIESKFSIIGAISDVLYVSQLPAALPKMGIVVRVNMPVDFKAKKCAVKILEIDGSQNIIGAFDEGDIERARQQSRKADLPMLGFIIRAVASPYSIPKQGLVRVLVEIDDSELVAGALRIIEGSRPPEPKVGPN